MKKIIYFLIVVCMVCFTAPCTVCAADRISCVVGDSGTCVARNPKGVKVRWKVSDSKLKVIKKNNYGLKFKADMPGSVKVTARLKATGQTLKWKITIKRKIIDMGKQVFEAGLVNTLSLSNLADEAVSWKVPDDNIDVVSKNDYSLSFVANAAGDTKVTAITKRYKYVWTVAVRQSDAGLGGLSEDSLQYVSELVTEYLAESPYSSYATEERIGNFCADLIAHLMTLESLPPDNEIIAYMDDISDYLYTDRVFSFPG